MLKPLFASLFTGSVAFCLLSITTVPESAAPAPYAPTVGIASAVGDDEAAVEPSFSIRHMHDIWRAAADRGTFDPRDFGIEVDDELAARLAVSDAAITSPRGPANDAEPFQFRRENSEAWEPDAPYRTDGPLPTDHEVRVAIVNGVNWVLDQQRPDGSWDVELTGVLGATADHAVDAVAATSLAGLGLRPHVHVDPDRINAALRRGADFVMARIIRGRLSLNVYYAVWRYTLGLRFLCAEYKALKAAPTPDTARMEEIDLVARRMIQSLLTMQKAVGDQGTLEGKKKGKVRLTRVKGTAQPATFGVLLQQPTDTDFRGGALVRGIVPGSAAASSGVRVGDRITRVLKVYRVENAYDFYMQEGDFLEGMNIEIQVTRQEGDAAPKSMTLNGRIPQRWPANIGVIIEPTSGDGVRVVKHGPASSSRKVLSPGDIIVGIANEKLQSDPKNPPTGPVDWVKKYYEVEATLKPASSIRLQVIKEGKTRPSGVTLRSDSVRPKNAGSLGAFIMEEDRASIDGVGVEDIEKGSPADLVGIKKGDRILEINGTPILGWDHYHAFFASMWQDTAVTVKYLSSNFVYEDEAESRTPVSVLNDLGLYENKEVEVRLKHQVETGNPEFGIGDIRRVANRILPMVGPVKKGGVADQPGNQLKTGDLITKVNGREIQIFWDFWEFIEEIAAGDEATIEVIRGTKDIVVKFEFTTWPDAEEEITAEGGWNYYPRAFGTSFTTAATVIALWEAETIMGIRYPRKSMKLATNALGNSRVKDPENRGQSYVYDERNQKEISEASRDRFADIRGTIGRVAACELALFLKDSQRRTNHLKAALEIFMAHRHEIDMTRNFWHTHLYKRYANAAYYWFYGHYHAVLACSHVDPEGKNKFYKNIYETTLKVVMLDLHDRRPGTDGANRPAHTWVEHQDFGPLVGTAQALMVLGCIPGGFRSGYTPTKGPGPVVTPSGGSESKAPDAPKPPQVGDKPEGASGESKK